VYFDFASMYTWAVNKYLDGTLKPVVNEAGIAEGIVNVSYSDDIPPEVRETVKAAEEAVKNGHVLFFLSGYPEKP
jgi:basic membrane protein A